MSQYPDDKEINSLCEQNSKGQAKPLKDKKTENN